MSSKFDGLNQDLLNRHHTDQLAVWPLAAENYRALDNISYKSLTIGDFPVAIEHNPARIRSSAAKTDAKSLATRPCFLCQENRPEHQRVIEYHDFDFLVNPYPIMPRHFTIVSHEHTPQRIADKIVDMVDFARRLPNSAIFYNGPKCGASAPDHMHFQAVDSASLSLYKALHDGKSTPFGKIVIDTKTADWQLQFHSAMSRLPKPRRETEAPVNIFCMKVSESVKIVIIPRRKHRPDFYGDAPDQFLISPASLEMAGVNVAPRREDFDRIDAQTISEIFRQVAYTQEEVDGFMAQPLRVAVGIVTAPEIEVEFEKGFSETGLRKFRAGEIPSDGLIFKGDHHSRFAISNVTIGIGFHWERGEKQVFTGDLEIVPDGAGNIVAINHIDIEEYLKSVISSEMSATSSAELLKAHAIISRSWLLDKIFFKGVPKPSPTGHKDGSPEEFIKWYGEDAHTLFDVCADDHCQRYQGVTRQTTAAVDEAVAATRGLVITYLGALCDARFSKCCGGAMETYNTCWDDKELPYLMPLRDDAAEQMVDLSDETKATEWIKSRPDAFCNTADAAILSQVLNNYDLETPDFYRWRVDYTAEELAEIIHRKSGIDFGNILEIKPLQRGASGRIHRLLIVGDKRTMIVGKELEIRKWLSPSHLYSSAFTVERTPEGFTLRGAGWGHGAGLCQIGAAVMAAKGYSHKEILRHYYPGSELLAL